MARVNVCTTTLLDAGVCCLYYCLETAVCCVYNTAWVLQYVVCIPLLGDRSLLFVYGSVVGGACSLTVLVCSCVVCQHPLRTLPLLPSQARLAQRVEHETQHLSVVGSTPTLG